MNNNQRETMRKQRIVTMRFDNNSRYLEFALAEDGTFEIVHFHVDNGYYVTAIIDTPIPKLDFDKVPDIKYPFKITRLELSFGDHDIQPDLVHLATTFATKTMQPVHLWIKYTVRNRK